MGLSWFFFLLFHSITVRGQKKNVLFITVDDLRPEINAFLGSGHPGYTHTQMQTPHLDELASRSLLLKRAYVQIASCSPSRTSFLTGRRPDTTHVYDLQSYWRKVAGNFTTIPQYFKQHGYASVGMGKIFHPGLASNKDDPISWTEDYFHAPNNGYWTSNDRSWIAVSDEWQVRMPLPDRQLADHAISTMQRLAPAAKSREQPFFLALGLLKPHLPFAFPEDFLQFYPTENVSLADNQYAPRNLPDIAWLGYKELQNYNDIAALNLSGAINSTLPENVALDLRKAYYSSVTYIDSLVGEMVGEIKRLELQEDTIVVFLGDHGFHLGEHGEWCKKTNFEVATQVPVLLHVPHLTNQGIVAQQLVELVDLFPTLAEAAGLPPIPLCPEDSSQVETCTEGTSFMSLIKEEIVPWKDRVFSQYPQDAQRIMGYTMRTDQYRYTEWVHFQGKPIYAPNWTELVGTELYDHQADPQENNNVAYDQSSDKLVQVLSQQLHDGWRAVTNPVG